MFLYRQQFIKFVFFLQAVAAAKTSQKKSINNLGYILDFAPK
ncbi:hypothetical protein E9S_06580 [Moraxella catarrhalis BC7]|nr:hypothetical protein E9S_06580 [Moraxella catarrhalis BC7]